jgi:heat shock protein HslJ
MHLLLRSFLTCLAVTCAIGSFSPPTTALDNAAPRGARPADLEGRAWQISNYFIDKKQTWPYRKIGQKSDAYVSFESGVLKGSPGCGRFTGTYHRAGEQLTISAEWTNEKEMPCGNDEKGNAEQILTTLTNVRGIHVAPAYWHSDALLLTDAKGSTTVTLSTMEPGRDLSELQDSFWHLTEIQGSHADLSGVIVDIGKGQITFSTASYLASFPFDYKLSGPEFHPAWTYTTEMKDRAMWRDQQLAKLFESCLRKVSSYDLAQGNLTLFGRDRRAIMMLTSLRREGIENRRWRIAKYRGDGSQHGDEEGLIDAREPAEITFLRGRVEGSPGCGGWVGTYKVSDDHVTVQAGWVLAGSCYPAGFAQDRLVEDAFKGELRIEEKGDHILLRDGHGNARILLVPY